MHGSIVKMLSAAALAVCIIGGTAAAQGKSHEAHGNGNGKGKGDERHDDEQHQVAIDQRHNVVVDQHHNVVVDEHHNVDPRHVLVTTSNADHHKVPPGLAKKGGMPPGQAKKYYRAIDGVPVVRDVFVHHGYTVVRTQPFGSSQYVYYRQANGPIQRAVIVPGTTQLGFQNVPQALVAEILSRLY